MSQNIDAPIEGDLTALHIAVQNRDYDRVVELLALGANPNTPDSHGDTPLFLAAGYGEAKILTKLIEKNGDADALNDNKANALMRAAYHDHAECCEILLKHMKKLTIDHQDHSYSTAVMWAVISGRTNALEVLLQHAPDLNLKDGQNRTAFGVASTFCMMDANNLIIEHANRLKSEREAAARSANEAAAANTRREAQTNRRQNRHTALRNYLRR